MKRAHFGPPLFAFLRELGANNDRAWFAAHKARYEEVVRDPLLGFISDFAAPLRKVAPRYLADPRPVGGSLFRIHRDTRFSKDKTPYKTQASAHFRHEAGKDVHSPGFYLHLEPGNVFGGFGLWRPEAEPLGKIRAAILEGGAKWKRATAGQALEGESLKRPPAGVDPSHPLLEDLKRKDFITSATFTEKQACAPDFLDRYTEACRAAAPLMRFLTTAVGLPW